MASRLRALLAFLSVLALLLLLRAAHYVTQRPVRRRVQRAAEASGAMQTTRGSEPILRRPPRATASLLVAFDMLVSPEVGARAAEAPRLEEQSLQCVQYSGPMFLPNNPSGKAPTRAVPGLRMPDALESQPTLHPTRLPLRAFSLHDVSLRHGSRFHVAQQTNVEWLRQLDPDRLLFFFRSLAQLPQPRAGLKPYGGWESAGVGLRGHMVGHYLSASAMAAASTGDAFLRTRLDNLTRDLEQVQEALGDGYLSAFPEAEFTQLEDFKAPYAWVPYYVMHKLLAGLLEVHRLWACKRALAISTRLAEHLARRVQRILAMGIERWHTLINQEVGGMSEALTDLALATANSSWLQLASMFERPCFIRPLALQYQRERALAAAAAAAGEV